MIFDQVFFREGLVRKLITDTGSSLQLKEIVTGAYDPEEGEAPTTENFYYFDGYIGNYKLKESGVSLNSEILIQKDDRKVYLAPRSDEIYPKAGNWYIKLDDQWWSIVTVKMVNPSGNYALLFECQCRLS